VGDGAAINGQLIQNGGRGIGDAGGDHGGASENTQARIKQSGGNKRCCLWPLVADITNTKQIRRLVVRW